MRDHVRASFRNAPHTSGVAQIKPRDFLPQIELDLVEAASPYAAWHDLLATANALAIGDVLESSEGQLFLCKFVGFDKAEWVLPEAKDGAGGAGEPAGAGAHSVEAAATATVS
jgi:hypothetical protein